LTLSVEEQANRTVFFAVDNKAVGVWGLITPTGFKYMDGAIHSAFSVPVKVMEGRDSNVNEEAETCKDSIDIDRTLQSSGISPTSDPFHGESAMSTRKLCAELERASAGAVLL
jgi:hypothetical protein